MTGYERHRAERAQPAADHAASPAGGGKYARRIRRGNLTATRVTHTKRPHGVPPSSGGLGMRPPGGGLCNYQDPNDRHAPRMYAGDDVSVDPETASIVSGSVADDGADV